MAEDVVFNPWSRSDKKRLYVNNANGDKLGYLDLATFEVVPAPDVESSYLQEALAALTNGRLPLENVSTAGVPEISAPASPPYYQMPWHDLALNPPGAAIAHLEDGSYKAGLAGEQRTAGVLSILERHGLHVLHSIPLTPRKDIDHLVIGRSGVHAINTKNSTYPVRAKPNGAVLQDNYPQTRMESLSRDADVASGYLSDALRMEVRCIPLVVVWSSAGVESECESIVDGMRATEAILNLPERYPVSWVETLFATARRSDTWTVRH